MITEPKPASVALQRLNECLLISYRHDRQTPSFTIVCDYFEKAPNAKRAFVRIHFDGVTNFEREAGCYDELQRFVDTYSARETRSATVVQAVTLEHGLQQNRVKFWFGYSFGSVAFSYTKALAETRNAAAVVKRAEDEWDYYDAADGSRFDFYEPFK